MIHAKSAEGDRMAPHWWVPVKASSPTQRKKDVGDALPKHSAALKSFWKTPDGDQLFALIKSEKVSHELLADIGANGRPIAIEEVT
jgi:hypothetical protein